MASNIGQMALQSSQIQAQLIQERTNLEEQIREARRDMFFRQMEVFRQEHEAKKAKEKAENRERNVTIGGIVAGGLGGGLGAIGTPGGFLGGALQGSGLLNTAGGGAANVFQQQQGQLGNIGGGQQQQVNPNLLQQLFSGVQAGRIGI